MVPRLCDAAAVRHMKEVTVAVLHFQGSTFIAAPEPGLSHVIRNSFAKEAQRNLQPRLRF